MPRLSRRLEPTAEPPAATALEDHPFLFARRSVASERHAHRNEDRILIDGQRGLVAVFDGVGGRPGGAVAAGIASRVIRRGWRRLLGE